jgi:hypothetical protein
MCNIRLLFFSSVIQNITRKQTTSHTSPIYPNSQYIVRIQVLQSNNHFRNDMAKKNFKMLKQFLADHLVDEPSNTLPPIYLEVVKFC